MTPEELAAIRERDAATTEYLAGHRDGERAKWSWYDEQTNTAVHDRSALLTHIDAITEAHGALDPRLVEHRKVHHRLECDCPCLYMASLAPSNIATIAVPDIDAITEAVEGLPTHVVHGWEWDCSCDGDACVHDSKDDVPVSRAAVLALLRGTP